MVGQLETSRTDAELVGKLRRGDARAVELALGQHARLVSLLVARVLDETLLPPSADTAALRTHLYHGLAERLPAMALEWPDGAQLDHAIALHVRPLCEAFLYQPDAITKDFRGLELVDHVQQGLQTIGKLATACMRMQLLSLPTSGMAAILGRPLHEIDEHLSTIAAQLAAVQLAWEPTAPLHSGSREPTERRVRERGADSGLHDAIASWKVLLGASNARDEVALALRAEDSDSTRAIRDRADEIHRLLRRPIDRRVHADTLCKQGNDVAAFVDGSLRGAERVQLEQHIVECKRCLDSATLLKLDMAAASLLRSFDAVSEPIALAATCLATRRASIAEELALLQADAGAIEAVTLLRCARAAMILQMGGFIVAPESSRVIRLRGQPSPEEAPLAAIEALVGGDINEAQRALTTLDDRSPLKRRLALLTAAAGHDLHDAHHAAADLLRASAPDPDLRYDAESIAALPPDRCLPHDYILGRLFAFLPSIVRVLFSRPE